VVLQTVVIIDYQNVHLTGHELFAGGQGLARHETLVHPLHYANLLIKARNEGQRPGMDHAALAGVLVYRGEPSADHDPDGYRRNRAQKAQWERDPRVRVHLRPLKYRYLYDAAGRKATDVHGKPIIDGPPREKGIDVLCALAVVREARRPGVGAVVLASHDTDLVPALDEAIGQHGARVETASWYDHGQGGRGRQQLRPTTHRIWNTRLGATEFTNCRDTHDYR
jgi:uncharacterized LabA/DUF88 family protein